MKIVYTLESIRDSGHLGGYIDPEQFPDGSFMAKRLLDIAETIDYFHGDYLRFLSPTGEIVIDDYCYEVEEDPIRLLIDDLRKGIITLEEFRKNQQVQWQCYWNRINKARIRKIKKKAANEIRKIQNEINRFPLPIK